MVSFHAEPGPYACYHDGNDQPNKYGEITEEFSDIVWRNINLQGLSEISDLEIRLDCDVDSNSKSAKDHTKGAFFFAHHDFGKEKIGTFDHEIDAFGALVQIDDWKFGRRPSVKLKFPENMNCQNLDFLLGAILARDPKDESESIELCLQYRFQTHGKTNWSDWDDGVVLKYQFKPGKSPVGHVELMEMLDMRGVYALDGLGNSIHPKQTMTIRNVEKYLNSIESEKVSIAYIGTDTAENIISLTRALKSKKLLDRVQKFDIYYDENWDEKLLEAVNNRAEDLAGIIDQTSLIRMKCDPNKDNQFKFYHHHDAFSRTEIKPQKVDLIVCTYVTPWAIMNELSEYRYIDLIKKLMADTSAVLSVDPATAGDVFRSHIGERFSIEQWYGSKLQLRPIKLIHPNETNNSVSSLLFSNGGL